MLIHEDPSWDWSVITARFSLKSIQWEVPWMNYNQKTNLGNGQQNIKDLSINSNQSSAQSLSWHTSIPVWELLLYLIPQVMELEHRYLICFRTDHKKIAHAARSLNPGEQNYNQIEKKTSQSLSLLKDSLKCSTAVSLLCWQTTNL